jgi:hypothetical protein
MNAPSLVYLLDRLRLFAPPDTGGVSGRKLRKRRRLRAGNCVVLRLWQLDFSSSFQSLLLCEGEEMIRLSIGGKLGIPPAVAGS